MHHEQDMRNMGGLRQHIPITWLMMLIGTLALTGVGIPHFAGFAGFHSKDAIIEGAYAAHTWNNYAFWVLVLAAFMTSFYSWRLMFMTFHQSPRWAEGHGGEHGAKPHSLGAAAAHGDDHGKGAHGAGDKHGHGDHHHHEPHESPLVMLIPLFVLAFGAIVAGYAFYKLFIGTGYGGAPDPYKAFWGKAIYEGKANHILHDMHKVPGWVLWAPTFAMLAGLALSYVYYIAAPWLPRATAKAFRPLYLFLLNKWYFDELYDWLFVRPCKAIGRLLWKRGDGTVIDGAIDGTAAGVSRVTGRVVKLQTGYVYHYAFAMLIGLAAIITWFMFASGGAR
jgi:NADH-quinone oxidoreductase subunit L